MIFRRHTKRLIPESPVSVDRLGRHVHHDKRSRKFVAPQATVLKSVTHRHYGSVLDQGQVGACTGFAAVDALNCAPLHKTGTTLHSLDAMLLYERATQLDPFPGSYPPTDTGSDGLDAAKAAVEKGYITGYSHAFGIDQALAALVLRPVITGTNWLTGMDTPDGRGLVHATGSVRGGHEYAVVGIDTRAKVVKCLQSWGKGWGVGGYFYLSWADWDLLLQQQGDVTVLAPG